jgi:hypothetical protein
MSARTTPMERIMDSIAGEVCGSLGGMIAGPGPVQIDPAEHCHEGCRQMDKECIFDRNGKRCRWSPTPAKHGSTVGPSAGN